MSINVGNLVVCLSEADGILRLGNVVKSHGRVPGYKNKKVFGVKIIHPQHENLYTFSYVEKDIAKLEEEFSKTTTSQIEMYAAFLAGYKVNDFLIRYCLAKKS